MSQVQMSLFCEFNTVTGLQRMQKKALPIGLSTFTMHDRKSLPSLAHTQLSLRK